MIYGPRAWVSSTPWKNWPDRSDFKKDKETPGVERIALEKSPGLMNTTQVFPSHRQAGILNKQGSYLLGSGTLSSDKTSSLSGQHWYDWPSANPLWGRPTKGQGPWTGRNSPPISGFSLGENTFSSTTPSWKKSTSTQLQLGGGGGGGSHSEEGCPLSLPTTAKTA